MNKNRRILDMLAILQQRGCSKGEGRGDADIHLEARGGFYIMLGLASIAEAIHAFIETIPKED